MSSETGLKLVVMPKAPEPKPEMSPYRDILDQAFELKDQISSLVIIAHMDDGDIKIFNALDENVDLLSFLEVVKMRRLQMINEYLNTITPAPGPVTA